MTDKQLQQHLRAYAQEHYSNIPNKDESFCQRVMNQLPQQDESLLRNVQFIRIATYVISLLVLIVWALHRVSVREIYQWLYTWIPKFISLPAKLISLPHTHWILIILGITTLTIVVCRNKQLV